MATLRTHKIREAWRVQELRNGTWYDVSDVCKTERTAKQRLTTHKLRLERESLQKIAQQVMAKKWGDIAIPQE